MSRTSLKKRFEQVFRNILTDERKDFDLVPYSDKEIKEMRKKYNEQFENALDSMFNNPDFTHLEKKYPQDSWIKEYLYDYVKELWSDYKENEDDNKDDKESMKSIKKEKRKSTRKSRKVKSQTRKSPRKSRNAKSRSKKSRKAKSQSKK